MFTRDELLATANVTPLGGSLPAEFDGAAVDSRLVQSGELFIALRGERSDGHRFIEAAVRAGAAAVLCSQPDAYATSQNIPQLVVANPVDTLQRLARARLARQPETRVIGIAGSNGKTTVKEATATLLAHLAPTLKPVSSFNTEVGVPLTLLRLANDHRYAVLEMGAQRIGEVASLCQIAPPQIGVVTVIGPEHLEYFGSMQNVIQGEREIVEALTAEGIAILNEDDPEVRAMAEHTKARVVRYGRSESADVRALDVMGDPLTGMSFTLSWKEEQADVQLRLPGVHAIGNTLAAASVALSCDMSLSAVAEALGEVRPLKRRGEVHKTFNGATLVDDSYNANRQSAVAAIDLLRMAHAEPDARRWLIFGDMLELGAFAPSEHALVGAEAAMSIDELVLVGSEVRATGDGAHAAGMPDERIHFYPASLQDAEALAAAQATAAAYVREHLQPGDLVLVKGSLGVGMDVLVRALVQEQEAGV
ncbi:MAG TPA: UDP-N-acetylmuramoyl-tripeptide--D-alanyl-D-alanine ligase [Ktedonobacterales bacterium]|nr:UDP-N-acetylmuramoyl-tripeptide--D-alanyl-D-alanine ligase [Ktedonobacterales bacterium]